MIMIGERSRDHSSEEPLLLSIPGQRGYLYVERTDIAPAGVYVVGLCNSRCGCQSEDSRAILLCSRTVTARLPRLKQI